MSTDTGWAPRAADHDHYGKVTDYLEGKSVRSPEAAALHATLAMADELNSIREQLVHISDALRVANVSG